jgi:hypothetical protein
VAQEVSRRPHTVEVRFDSDAVNVGFVVVKVVLGQSFLRHASVLPRLHSINTFPLPPTL